MSKQPELIDFLLGERDDAPSSARSSADTARYADAIALLREAAAEPIAPVHRLPLRAAAAAAAVFLIAVGAFLLSQDGIRESRAFEPAAAFGALFPEELGADGSCTPTAQGDGYHVRAGRVFVSAIGGREEHPFEPGEAVLEESEVRCGADGGARLDLPHGGQLYLAPLSTVQLRSRADGRVALRVLHGTAATVAAATPMHIALDGTDLLMSQTDGAALFRRAEADAACLRGTLELHLAQGDRWRVPVGECLPAVCAHDPESAPMRVEEFEFDWYDQLIGQERRRRETVVPGAFVDATPHTLLYVRARAAERTTLTIRYGEGSRTYELPAGRDFEIRVPLRTIGEPGTLEFEPRNVIRAARLFE